jgi:hypothetical protein
MAPHPLGSTTRSLLTCSEDSGCGGTGRDVGTPPRAEASAPRSRVVPWRGGHIEQAFATNGISGIIAISAATSASKTFTRSYAAPVCRLTPVGDPTAVEVYWATATTGAITANVITSGTLTFNYFCAGNPR